MDFGTLRDFMDRICTWRIPGNTCVVYKDRKQVFRYSAGFANVDSARKMTGDERMFMFSTSKLVTCTAALMLWEKGYFLMSDPLYKYLPEWEHMTVRDTDSDGNEIIRPAKTLITIGDLFGMTSGLDYGGDKYSDEVLKKYRPACKTRDIVREFAKAPLQFDPGTRWRYGLSHDVIGALVEVISGERFADYCKKRIFEPLNMTSTEFGIDNSLRPTLATLYNFNDGLDHYERVPSQENSMIFGTEYDSGGAGVVSTVGDMALLTDMLANGGTTRDGQKILSAGTIDLMRTNRISEKLRAEFAQNGLEGYGYGFGVRTLVNKAEAGSPSSLGEFGWSGAAGSYLLADPENRLAMFYAHHMLNNQEPYVTPRLRNILYSCIK